MLWKKESGRCDAPYVDICSSGPKGIGINLPSAGNQNRVEVVDIFRTNITSSTHNKNDSVALQKRMKGNELFGRGKWADAMEMYNESLCFAKPKSPHISLAYANRSSCFLKMKKYNECLIDIDMAIECGYPKNLMSKLEKRRADCMECIGTEGNEQSGAYEPKLNFEPNETFPCLANVVNLQQDEDGICSVIAKEDIAVGQTIAIEEAFTTCLHMRYGSKCTVCLKPDTNLTACPNCTIAMFCSDDCRSDSIHEYECGVNLKRVENMEYLRSVLQAINMFPNVDELIHFVEQIKMDDPTDVPANLTDPKLNYRSFLKSTYDGSAQSLHYLGVLQVYPVYKVLLDIPKIGAMFDTEYKRRFLMHLIGQHALVTEYNLQGTTIVERGAKTQSDREPKMTHTMTGSILKYFGHSCAPNVHSITVHNKFVYYTIRPIKSGETLRRSMVLLLEPKQKRHETLRQYHITCKCQRCDGQTALKSQRKQLSSDPGYRFLQEKMSNLTSGDLQEVNDKSVSFLTKYGRMTWCDEIGEVISFYTIARSMQWLGGLETFPEAY
ncbi:SET and MYND domain-containing protein 4-like isoform X2 [Sitodiplosis mosellana]|nr:SET and MYND domain-containing protein 4-like isoform X2 [Sitodiplosis mosellana]